MQYAFCRRLVRPLRYLRPLMFHSRFRVQKRRVSENISIIPARIQQLYGIF